MLKLFLVVLLLSATVRLLAAQSSAGPDGGSRIRFTPAAGSPVIGHLVQWTPDTIVLETAAGQRRFGLAADARVERSVGKRSQAGRGARIGALVGLVAGMALGFASGDDDPNGWFAMTAGEKALAGGVLLGGTGGLLGLIVGATHRVDRWEEVGP